MDRLTRRVRLMGEIADGLYGKPFRWGTGEHSSKKPLMADLGFELVTKTGAVVAGHRLKRGAKPVGHIYFGAPIGKHCPVYVLGVDTTPERAP